MPAALLLSVLLLAACAGTPRCEQAQVHDNARLGRALSAPPELQLPAADETMTIPSASQSGDQGHPRMRPDGSCINQPPRFVPPESGG